MEKQLYRIFKIKPKKTKTKKSFGKKRRFSLILNFIFFVFSFLIYEENSELTPKILFSKIDLVIKGNGLQHILYNEFEVNPSQIYINNISMDDITKKSFELTENENNITLIFNETIKTCYRMFLNLTNITKINLSNFDCSLVTRMNEMFSGCSSLNSIDLSNLNTSSVKIMDNMFDGCLSLTTINVSSFDTSKVTWMNKMFQNCISLKSIDLSSFDTSSLERMGSLFYGCEKLISVNISSFNTSKATMIQNMFYNCYSIKSIDISNFNTASVVYMSAMFHRCYNLTSINVSHFDTSKVRYIQYLFNECYSLKSIDVSNFDVSKVQDMARMFSGCKLITSLDLSNFNASCAYRMENLFSDCFNLASINLQNFDTSNATFMHGMFQNCYSLESVNIPLFNTYKADTMYSMFYNCRSLKSINLTTFNTSLVKSFENMFYNCSSLTSISLSNFDTSKASNMRNMFYGCNKLTSIDISNFDTSNITNMENMFWGCYSLISIDLYNFNTSKVSNMKTMFYNCSLINMINLSIFDTSLVTNFGGMFYGCNNLSSIFLSNFQTSKVTDMRNMFYGCYNLISIDLSNFETSSVNNMEYMFYNCSSLDSINLSNFDTFQVTNMEYMFCGCNNLHSINTSNFNTSNVTNMKNLFEDCNSLNSIDISNFNTTKVTNMEYMFNGCHSLTSLNLSTIDTSSVTSIKSMFSGCDNLKLVDISNFNTNNVEYMDNLFDSCRNLITLNLSNFNIIKTKSIQNMFYNCSSLKYLNIYSFSIPQENNIKINDMFSGVDPNLIYCINDNHTKYSLLNKDNIFICSDTCYNENNTIFDIVNQLCIAPLNIDIKSDALDTYMTFSSLILYQTDIGYSKLDIINKLNLLINNNTNNSNIYELIKENIISIYTPDIGKNLIVKGADNTMFQVTDTKTEIEYLKNISNNVLNVTIIDLGECEKKLREIYKIDDKDYLIFIKKENISNKITEKNIKYEIFEPYNKTKLNLSLCEDTDINLYIPMELSKEIRKTYEDLKELGYDMTNINDPFYQDICTPFDSPDGTDILLSDRINYIYHNNDAQCQQNCKLSQYSVESKFINCTCSTNEDIVYENNKNEEKFTAKKIYESFYDVLKYSNYKVLKCTNLIFDKKGIITNIGGMIIISCAFIHSINLLFFVIKRTSTLVNKLKGEMNKINSKNSSNINGKDEKVDLHSPIKKKGTHRMAKKRQIINKKENKKRISNFNTNTKKIGIIKAILGQNNDISDIKTKRKLINSDFKNRKDLNIFPKDIIKSMKKLSDYELNELSFEKAKIYDKRNIFQIYFSKLRRENLIIFTFLVCDDYNLFYIKLSRFLFLIATDMTFNAFFFSDDTMHKLFLNYGKYDFFQQIPQIVYTTLVSQIIEVFLCFLSMTDRPFYQIKELVSKGNLIQSEDLYRNIHLKLSIFYIFTYIFFIFYYYMIYSFCAVYKNTQLIFIKDSIISFCISLTYNLVLYFISSCLKVCSLRSSTECLYKFSELIPFF